MTKTSEKIKVDSELVQRCEPIKINGDIEAFCKYTIRNKGKEGSEKILEIRVPDLHLPGHKRGLTAKFFKPIYTTSRGSYISAGTKCYQEDEAVEAFEKIRPILEKQLPRYMAKLMNPELS
ncbi:MAG: hypothetical protein WCX73_02410 [Candidatus Pacearchaeota archaeon]|jgi:hypothetical protein